MTKFQKFQLYFSIIPGLSSALVFIVTMLELKRRRASVKEWIKFLAVFFGFGILAAVVETFVMSGGNPILNTIVFTLIMALANYFCIDQQVHCESRSAQQEKNYQEGKKITWIIAGVIGSVAVTTALVLALAEHTGSSHIEDRNGPENSSLAVITMKDLLSVENDYAATLTRDSQTGQQTNVRGRLADCDYTKCSLTAKKLSGIHTLQATQINANSMTLHVEATLFSGNMEVILIVDGEYMQHIPVNSKQSITLDDIANKLVLVKLAAESAEVSVTVEREMVQK